MGAFFSSNQLDGATSNGVPTISYAYSTNNEASFGVDATYTYLGSAVIGLVTPYLVQPNTASPTITCTPFSAYSSYESLLCPIAVTLMDTGLYTVSFSQFESTQTYNFISTTWDTFQLGSTTISVPGEVTFSITTTATATESSTRLSGVLEILPTETNYVPSSFATVTAYYTTIVSTVLSTQTSSNGIIVKTVTAACPLKCNHNNCYRGLFSRSAVASAFCNAFTAGAVISPLPTYVSKCKNDARSISSACSCIFPTIPTAAIDERGVLYVYAPPDFTFTQGQLPLVTTTVFTNIPSNTVIDPPATISSGISTSTVFIDSTVTVTTIVSSVSGGTTSTVTKPAKNCR